MTAVSRSSVTRRTLGAAAVALLVGVTARPTAAQAPVDANRLVQRNISGALEMLAERDLSGLTAEQRSKRAWIVAELKRYQAASAFPQNRHFPGDNVPYFVDKTSGAVCAVGHLMVASGHRELVERIAADDNNVWVLELAADPEVGAWLDEHGLTLSEAARIQMPYVGDGPGDGGSIVANESARTAPLLGASVALATAGVLFNSFVERGHESRDRMQLGIITGLLAVGVGAESMGYDKTRSLGRTALAMGAVSLLASSNIYMRLRKDDRIRVTPIIPTGREDGAGLSLSLTF